MITLSVLFLLIFVPGSRRMLFGFLRGIVAILTGAFLITRNSGGRRRGF